MRELRRFSKRLGTLLLAFWLLCSGFAQGEEHPDTENADAGNVSTETIGSAEHNADNAEIHYTPDNQELEVMETAPLSIETKHAYSDMNRSYAKGYSPTISNGSVHIVLPLATKEEMVENCVTACMELSALDDSVFSFDNVEKPVKLKEHKIKGSEKTKKIYLVEFDLKLKQDRRNGSYPVTIHVKGKTQNGVSVAQTFQVFVTITDGKEEHDGEGNEMQVSTDLSTAKLMVEKWEYGKEVTAGEEFTIHATIKNMDKTEEVSDIMVALIHDNDKFILKDGINTAYLERLDPGQSGDVSFCYETKPDLPSGQYRFEVNMDYQSRNGSAVSQAGCFVIVRQPVRIETELVYDSDGIEDGDVIPVTVNVMNLGQTAIYNARAEIQGEEIYSKETGFIGEVSQGTLGTCQLKVYINKKRESEAGYSEATAMLKYEDDDGTEYINEMDIYLTIHPISILNSTDNRKKSIMQWWGTIGAVVLLTMGLFGAGRLCQIRRKRDEEA